MSGPEGDDMGEDTTAAGRGGWRDGLEAAGSCPRCGIHVFVDAAGRPAGGLPRPVYLCDCRLAERPAPAAPPPPWTPALPWMPPGPGGNFGQAIPQPPCQHCHCILESSGTWGSAFRACCKCGDRVAAAPFSPWCGSPAVGAAQAVPDAGPCLGAQSTASVLRHAPGVLSGLAGVAGPLRRCPPEGVTAAGTLSALQPRR